MIETGFDSKVKVQQIISNQLPEFLLSESPNSVDFFKQYYISQEYQGGPIDISDNLDEYLRVDNLTSDVVKGNTTLSAGITTESTTITVANTKGYPDHYGLLKINNEIITYTGLTTNTFTGCIRGFSGITSYHAKLNEEELVFSTSEVSSHNEGENVENLSALFLKEFFKKLKFTLVPGMDGVDFKEGINVGNFIKEARSLYESKGTPESFRILFNVLYGETPKIINLEDYLIKPSSAEYVRREVIIAEAISGEPKDLIGQTIYKLNDLTTNASISEVEPFTRVGVALTTNQQYYKISLFLGPNDKETSIQGTFSITPASKCTETVAIGASVISVDSTIGFGATGLLSKSGTIISGINTNINYTHKSLNQFFGCTGIDNEIESGDTIRNDDIYFGYANGDVNKKVELRLTGVLSKFDQISKSVDIDENQIISVKNLGDLIKNPTRDRTYKEILANSWIYNTSVRYKIDEGAGGDTTLKFFADIDRSSLKLGDYVEILRRGSNSVISGDTSTVSVTEIVGQNKNNWWDKKCNEINISPKIPDGTIGYLDLRRKLSSPISDNVLLSSPNIISDVQNFYVDGTEEFYIASNSLPTGNITGVSTNYRHNIDTRIQSVVAAGLTGFLGDLNYKEIQFNNKVPFVSGDEIYYEYTGISTFGTYVGLDTGNYFVGISDEDDGKRIKLYNNRALINNDDYIKLNIIGRNLSDPGHKFTLASQQRNIIGPQKILRKFPFNTNIDNGDQVETKPGTTGVLINGVEISNYKGIDKIYYGPLLSVDVLGEGDDYDVVNPPKIEISAGVGTTAITQAVLRGSIKDVLVDPQGYDVQKVISITASGGNGSAVLEPIVIPRSREVSFDGRTLVFGGGINTTTNTITFDKDHTFSNLEEVIYKVGTGNSSITIGVGNSALANNASYFVNVVDTKTVRLHESRKDAELNINQVSFNGRVSAGIHNFATLPNQKTVIGVRVEDGGTFTNRKLRLTPSVGVSTVYNTLNFKNHGFEDGDLVNYTFQTSAISGLSTENQYFVNKIDNNSFQLSNAGVGGTIIGNYERKDVVNFANKGEGYQYFAYPDISVSLKYTPVGFGTTSQTVEEMVLTPSVRGSIIDTYLYESGTGYGSSILNFEKKPIISIKNGKDGNLKPIFVNGKIDQVNIQYGGVEYFSIPTLEVIDSSGKGSGAKLRPVVTDGRISDVVVVNTGIGYSHLDTSINVVSAGKNATLDAKVRPLTVNLREKYKKYPGSASDGYKLEDNKDEAILSEGIENTLQYNVCAYGEPYRQSFNEVGTGNTQASKIIGWAYDGNPIYGPYGYSNAGLSTNPRRLVSGYTLDTSNVENRPSGFSDGYFIEDYKFTNSGDLDRNNGRFGKTPEFPEGVYAYFATIKSDLDNNEPEFPYFIGNSYRSTPVTQNLNQEFDFKDSNLIRNTFPYRISDKNVDNDFIIETNEIERQKVEIESVTTGSVEKLNIVNSGKNYKIGDLLTFDESGTSGGGLRSKVSSLEGIDILNVSTGTSSYTDRVFSWVDESTVKVTVFPSHDWKNKDNVVVSGFSTTLASLNGSYTIGVSSLTSVLSQNLNSGTVGMSTDIFVSDIPTGVSVGSTLRIGAESLRLLNIFKNENILRVQRGSGGVSHTASSPITFVPDSFTIKKSIRYFESKPTDRFYFNPHKTIGVGVTPGISIPINFTFAGIGITRDVTTQSIYLEDHPFKDAQELTFSTGGGNAILISDTAASGTYSMPSTVYVTNSTKNSIGIKTGIGTTSGDFNDVFFRGNGSNINDYSFASNYTQQKGRIDQFNTTVALSTAHDLKVGDKVVLTIEPDLNVGLGTTTPVKVERQTTTGYLLLDPVQVTNSGVSTTADSFTITNHRFNTGDKVYYEVISGTYPSGLSEGTYFTYVIDVDTFQLCKTNIDATGVPPVYVNFTNNPTATHKFSRVNPSIEVVNTNSLVFDLTHSSLSDYKFKLYYDKEFKNEFTSIKSDTFNITGVGTVGVGASVIDSSLTVGYSTALPRTLYYNIQKSGFISTSDTTVPNYSEIVFVDSHYNRSYDIVSIGASAFNITLEDDPERLSYESNQCNVLKYTTTSLTSKGGIENVNIISAGSGYKKLPSFVGSSSTLGEGAYVIPSSTKIGNAKEIRFINEGFEYSSDSTLRPEAFISPFVVINNSNTIGIITITSGGVDYINAPNIKVVNSNTGQEIDSGFLEADLIGSTIGSVDIINSPSGLPDEPVRLVAVNNDNGVGIVSVQSNASGIFTCWITTPSVGFSTYPFNVNDKVYTEGIEKVGAAGSGFNSSNWGYEFAVVSEVVPGGAPLPENPSQNNGVNFRVSIDATGVSTNTGIAKTDQSAGASLINEKKYPTFVVTQKPDLFIEGEILIRDSVELDLYVSKTGSDFIKVTGNDILVKGDRILGKDSGTLATVDSITEYNGRYVVNFSVKKDIGWTNEIGKLSVDSQVTPDNDYYQNLSYSIQSTKGFDELRSPVSAMLHTSGLKNFADVGIRSTSTAVGPYDASLGKRTGIGSADFTETIQDLLGYNRVDTIYDYDRATDGSTDGSYSTLIEFENKTLSDYFKAKSNEVIVLDDIDKLFSNLSGEPSEFLDLIELQSNTPYQNLFIRITNADGTDIQTSELIIMNNGGDITLIEKQNINDSYYIGDFSISEEAGLQYLRFTPLPNAYDYDYDLKLVKTEFNAGTGIGTNTIGFVDKVGTISVATTTTSGVTTTSVISGIATAYNSFYTSNQLLNRTTNEMNYVDIFVTHDGTNTYMSQAYADNSERDAYSDLLLGSFSGNITGNTFSLDFENSLTDEIEIRSNIVGFGTTSVGIGTYRFQVSGQPDGSERSAIYQSDYSYTSGTRNVVGFNTSLFNSVKSVVEVSIGSTKALHQIVMNHNTTDVYLQQGPYLSVGSIETLDTKLGIGTFGGEYVASNFVMKFYPNAEFASDNIEVSSLSLGMYSSLDSDNLSNVTDLTYGKVTESLNAFSYNAIDGERINRTSFPLTVDGLKIFAKQFNPSDSNALNLTTGKFSITDHFFRTGEELIYKAGSTFVGVGSTAMQYESAEGVDELPSPVFAIREDADNFYIATTKALANAGTAVTFVSVGEGNSHEFSMSLANTKNIITLDNIIQSPISYSPVSHTLENNIESVFGSTGIGTTSTTFSLSGISSISLNDVLKIDDEFVKVIGVGMGTETYGPIVAGIGTTSLVTVERGVLGTGVTAHSNTSTAQLYKGSYNIVGNNIHFIDPPRGNPQITKTKGNLEFPRTEFNGRVFLRDNYDTNQIYDDISHEFTGIGQTFDLKVDGSGIVGMGTTGGNGLVIINGIYQRPTTPNNPLNNFIIKEPSGVSTNITFTGITSVTENDIVINPSDINQNQLPRGGVIISLGSTPGLGYAPLDGAVGYLEVGAGGSITSVVGIATTGPAFGISTATYNHVTGRLDIVTTESTNFELRIIDQVKLVGLEFTCATAHAGVTTTIFPEAAIGAGNTDKSYPILNTEPTLYTHTFVSATSTAVNGSLQPTAATYDSLSGDLVLTFASAHGISNGSNITIANNSIIFTCSRDEHATQHSYPRSTDPASGTGLTVSNATAKTLTVNVGSSNNGLRRFTTNVGTSTIPHTYVGGGSVVTYYANANFGSGYRGTVSIGVTDHPFTHRFVSAGIGSITDNTTATHTASNASYDGGTGDLILTIPSHGLTDSNTIQIDNNSLVFTCSKDEYSSHHSYPRTTDPVSGIQTAITNATTNTITVNVGSSVGSGATVTATVGAGGTLAFAITGPGTNYANPQINIPEPSYAGLEVTGVSRIGVGNTTDTGTGLLLNCKVSPIAYGVDHKFVSAVAGSITATGIGTTTATDATYDPLTGNLVLTIAGHGLDTDNTIGIDTGSLVFRCAQDNYASVHSYPRATDPIALAMPISIGSTTVNTITVNVGVATDIIGVTTQFGVTEWEMVRNGYGFKRGDIFTPVGLVTALGLSSPIRTAEFEVLDTFHDAFSAWQFGQLDYMDDIKDLQDGSRRRFQLKYDGDLLSFEVDKESGYNFINLENCLLIVINGVVQEPGVAYKFNGGTSFVFTEPPAAEDDVSIYFYRGSSQSDTELVTTIKPQVEAGDDVQLMGISDNINQNERTISAIFNSNTLETNIYSGPGITTEEKSLNWTKQKKDKIVNGNIIYKTRNSIEALIFPTAKVISGFSTSDNTQFFVDNVDLFGYDAPFLNNAAAFIVDKSTTPIAADLTANVSTAGTITSLTIVSGGSGYVGSTTSVSVGIPTVGIGSYIQANGLVGFGTTATATATITNGTITATTIVNPGFGYTNTNAPLVIAPSPTYKTETVTGISSVQGFTGIITGIGTTAGIGTALALKFHLDSTTTNWSNQTLKAGYPISIFDTSIGTGVTSVYESGNGAVGIGTTFLDNIYRLVYDPAYTGTLGIITCNIASETGLSGLSTSGEKYSPVGAFSWGRLYQKSGSLTRATNPIGIALSNYTVNSGLTTFPTLQRRDEGMRDSGAIKSS